MFVYQGQQSAISAAFGGASAMLLSSWLGASLKRLDRRLGDKQKAGAGVFVFGFIPRFILVLALFSLGLGYLGLSPLPMLAAFIAAYAAYWVELYRMQADNPEKL